MPQSTSLLLSHYSCPIYLNVWKKQLIYCRLDIYLLLSPILIARWRAENIAQRWIDSGRCVGGVCPIGFSEIGDLLYQSFTWKRPSVILQKSVYQTTYRLSSEVNIIAMEYYSSCWSASAKSAWQSSQLSERCQCRILCSIKWTIYNCFICCSSLGIWFKAECNVHHSGCLVWLKLLSQTSFHWKRDEGTHSL